MRSNAVGCSLVLRACIGRCNFRALIAFFTDEIVLSTIRDQIDQDRMDLSKN